MKTIVSSISSIFREKGAWDNLGIWGGNSKTPSVLQGIGLNPDETEPFFTCTCHW